MVASWYGDLWGDRNKAGIHWIALGGGTGTLGIFF